MALNMCSWDGCVRKARSKNLCAMHYMRDRTFRRAEGFSDGEKIIGSRLLKYKERMNYVRPGQLKYEERTNHGQPGAAPAGVKVKVKDVKKISARWSDAAGRVVAEVRNPSSIRAAMRVAEVLRPFGRRDRKRIVQAVLAELS